MYGDRIQLSDDSKVMAMDTDACTTISCAAGNSIIALDNNFNVFPCIYGVGFNSYKMGNLLKESLEDIWMSEKWSKFRGDTTLQELEDCRDCKFSGKCSLKNCRLKPVFEGRKFTSSVSYCKHTA